ncbi:MAG: hypothetical protein AAGC55_02415 [Myxococcota bacterium]
MNPPPSRTARPASARMLAVRGLTIGAAPMIALAAMVVATAMAGCVEPFRGSNVQITLAPGVPAVTAEGATPTLGAPPANTYLSMYAVEFVVERDEDGDEVVDSAGRPVVVDSFAFHVIDFEIRPVIDLDSPCFIELDDSRFPGLHVTRFADKLREATGITDPHNAPDADDNDVIDVLTADRRMSNLALLEGGIKAVVSRSDASYPEVGTRCPGDGGDPALIPPIECIDDASNRLRLVLCQRFWASQSGFYEGNDKVFTIPLSGDFFGVVDGLNPINQGFLSGAGFFVDAVLGDLDSLLINYQYKDRDGDGQPDYPAGEDIRSDIGFPFMQGTPISRARGVINVPVTHPTVSTISGEAVIFPDLGEDDVNF